MNTTDVLAYIDHLDTNLESLSESLTTLLPTDSLSDASKTLPLLDRAKLHTTVVYAINSLIFCSLHPSLSKLVT